jgi:hypothetical protein
MVRGAVIVIVMVSDRTPDTGVVVGPEFSTTTAPVDV